MVPCSQESRTDAGKTGKIQQENLGTPLLPGKGNFWNLKIGKARNEDKKWLSLNIIKCHKETGYLMYFPEDDPKDWSRLVPLINYMVASGLFN